MNNANEYNRSFLYFKPEDNVFDNGLVPSGFVSFEVRNGKGKLTAFIENLSELSEKYEYKLYLISSTEAQTTPAFVTNIKPVKNKAQVSWSFDALNVGGSRLHFDEYNIVAVLAECKEHNTNIISPLVAYKGAKSEWKNKLRDILHMKKSEELRQYATKEHGFLNDKQGKQTRQGGHIEGVKTVVDQQTERVQPIKEAKQAEQAEQAEQGKWVEGAPYIEEVELLEQSRKNEQIEQKEAASTQNIEGETRTASMDSDFESNPNAQQYSIYCKQCPNKECNKNNIDKTETRNDKFTNTFNKYLERCDPFNSGRKDYVWWKAGSTYYLNTILYWINVRTPIMLSPTVFNAACKYGHLIIGIYTDVKNNDKYLVFGIPGKFGTEMKPFGELGRWAQADISKPEYDAFGYWLIYMDPNSARVIE